MKVCELMEMLKHQDPNKEVMIQQGEEFDYMTVYTVRRLEVINPDDEDPTDAVVIEFS
jgi:hypothetical protein